MRPHLQNNDDNDSHDNNGNDDHNNKNFNNNLIKSYKTIWNHMKSKGNHI